MSFSILSSAIGKINFFGEWLDYMRLKLRDQILTLGVRFIENIKGRSHFQLETVAPFHYVPTNITWWALWKFDVHKIYVRIVQSMYGHTRY